MTLHTMAIRMFPDLKLWERKGATIEANFDPGELEWLPGFSDIMSWSQRTDAGGVGVLKLEHNV